MSEDEAKTKVCFQAAGFEASEGTATGYGREARNSLPLGRCIGSACMAWRTHREARAYGVHGHTAMVETGHGFCGLAGDPS